MDKSLIDNFRFRFWAANKFVENLDFNWILYVPNYSMGNC